MSAQIKPASPDYVGRMAEYCRGVLDGSVVSCAYVRQAVERHYRDLDRAESEPDYPYEFSEWHADDVCGFYELMPHIKGQWDTPTLTAEPWICFVLGCVFGWRRKSDGLRRFDTVYLEVARKNVKSTLSGVVALYCANCEGEPGADVRVAATTGDQARIVYDSAKKMAERLPQFCQEFGIRPMVRAIECRATDSEIKPINAKASTQDGLNPHCAILDELHAHATRELFDVLRSARGARRNPLSWYITTAGYNLHGVAFQQRRLVVQVLEQTLELEHYFGIIYTIDKEDDEFDEAAWPKANPNWNVSVQAGEFEGYAAEAKASPEALSEFRTKRLNVWGGAKDAWLPMDKWQMCDGEVDLEYLERVPCYGALDLAATQDTTAKVLVWRVREMLYVWPRIYVPEAAIEPRSVRFSLPYDVWQRNGWLVVTEGDVTDYAVVEHDLRADAERFEVVQWAYDPWNSYDLVNRCTEDGLPFVLFRQGAQSYNEPMRQLEMAVVSGRLAHGGHPVLTWQAGNLVARRDVNDAMAPDKKNSKEKIDAMCALLMALGRLLVGEQGTRNVYDEQDLMVI